MFELIVIVIFLLCLCFAGLAIKIWTKKDGEFAGTCASQSPFLNPEGESCSLCGKTANEIGTCQGKEN